MWTQRQITDKQVNVCQYLLLCNDLISARPIFSLWGIKSWYIWKLVYMKILPESYFQKDPNPVNIGKLKMIHKLPQCCYVEVSC